MKRANWLVGDYGVRPAGKPGECFYCHAKITEEHQEGCVIRRRTILVMVGFPVVLTVPEDWDEGQIDRWLNEGTSCADNLIQAISDQADRMGCSCSFARARFVREAESHDEAQFLKWVKDEKS